MVSRKSISGVLICLGLVASGADVSAHIRPRCSSGARKRQSKALWTNGNGPNRTPSCGSRSWTVGGVAQLYGLEGMSPSWLGRHGWSNHSFAAGDKVKVALYPLRDGRLGGFYLRVTRNGQTLEALPQQVP